MRKNINVKTIMKETGEIVPLAVVWENGKEYQIDRVLSVRPAPSKSGGYGLRYEVCILGQIKFLYLDQFVWFIDTN